MNESACPVLTKPRYCSTFNPTTLQRRIKVAPPCWSADHIFTCTVTR